MDLYTNVQFLLRWLHVIAGIAWIGHLYFFNFVNIPFQGTLGADVKKTVNPQLIPRALWWFRWGAMTTFIVGLILFTQLYMYTGGGSFGPNNNFIAAVDGSITGRAWWIMFGMLCGTIMWFNVWFIIWPAQQVILRGVRDGVPADPALPKRAALASRINTYLSAPMLFGMLGANHGSFSLVTGIIAIALGLIAIWWAYKTSTGVAKTI